ncbi:MAG: sigma-54-dependent Fis family transcriptional regulator [Ignavibacteria bacterium]|nr:sigma-54-dependent Fis family transcriptional regulator [Ignavibacteria bacterium]
MLLDEIADMPYNLQSKLLRVIENWEIKPLGSDKTKNVDVRLISATNQNLRDMISRKKFREDLYFRISTVSINLPSLNERKEDIPLLVNYLLNKFSVKFGRTLSIDANGLDILIKNDWKGNIRELENVLERAVISSTTDILSKKNFKFLQDVIIQKNPFDLDNVSGDIKQMEKYYILKILEENSWNKLKVSQILGIDRKTLYKKISDYGLE